MDITNEQKFGEYIKELREEKGYSLRDVADLCSFSAAHLSNLERGKNTSGRTVKATPQVIMELSKVYGCSYSVLMEKAGYGEVNYIYNSQAAKFLFSENEEDLPTVELIGERIQRLMLDRGLTVKDLSAHISYFEYRSNEFSVIKYDEDFINNVLNNISDPPGKFIVAAADFFRVSCDWLLTGKEYASFRDSSREITRLLNEAKDHLSKVKEVYEHELLRPKENEKETHSD